MKEKPLVSIVIPVYNGANYMAEAIDSALAQTYENIEIIVVNDGSTDSGETEAIAKSYGDKLTYYNKKNGGVSTALNFAIKKMRGDFFSWLSHDDLIYPNKIESQINYLTENNLIDEKVILYSNYDVINEKSKVTNTMQFELYYPNEKPEYALLHGLVSGISMLIPKSAFKEHGNFSVKYRCIQDFLLFFEFMKTYKYIFIPETTNATRLHGAQVTNVNPEIADENNYLWIKMMKELSTEAKVRLEGSEYGFYKEMHEYMVRNDMDYEEAKRYAFDNANELLIKYLKKLDKVMRKSDENEMFYYIYKGEILSNHIFPARLEKQMYKYISLEANKRRQNEFEKIIIAIGVEKTIEHILSDGIFVKTKNGLKLYKKLYKYIVSIKKQKDYSKRTRLSRLIVSIRMNGFGMTIKKVKNKVLKKILRK